MACRWMHDPEIGRWWLPECIGGIYDKAGCTCVKPKTEDRIALLEKRIEKLERALARNGATLTDKD